LKLQEITKQNSQQTLHNYQERHNYKYIYSITLSKIPNKSYKESYVNDRSVNYLLKELNKLNQRDNIIVSYNVMNKSDHTHSGTIHYHCILFAHEPLSKTFRDQFMYEKNIQLSNFQYYIKPIESNDHQTQEEGLKNYISYIYDRHYISKIYTKVGDREKTISYRFSDISAYKKYISEVFICLNLLRKEIIQCILRDQAVKGVMLCIFKIIKRGTYKKFNPI